mmetsp:Transcript_30620/g.94683  ORF Transcript_30620/g.94683 Transcript_30620/m.94683 type:complete len:201 (-) Transcript_30620:260-862(-)
MESAWAPLTWFFQPTAAMPTHTVVNERMQSAKTCESAEHMVMAEAFSSATAVPSTAFERADESCFTGASRVSGAAGAPPPLKRGSSTLASPPSRSSALAGAPASLSLAGAFKPISSGSPQIENAQRQMRSNVKPRPPKRMRYQAGWRSSLMGVSMSVSMASWRNQHVNAKRIAIEMPAMMSEIFALSRSVSSFVWRLASA